MRLNGVVVFLLPFMGEMCKPIHKQIIRSTCLREGDASASMLSISHKPSPGISSPLPRCVKACTEVEIERNAVVICCPSRAGRKERTKREKRRNFTANIYGRRLYTSRRLSSSNNQHSHCCTMQYALSSLGCSDARSRSNLLSVAYFSCSQVARSTCTAVFKVQHMTGFENVAVCDGSLSAVLGEREAQNVRKERNSTFCT